MKNVTPIFLMIACCTFLPEAQALNPPPDGGYAGFTTAEGTNALKNLSTGVGNTAAGWYSLFMSSTASFNTAVGAGTLLVNTADENTATGALALFSNTTGNNNNAFGFQALFSNTTGPFNNAFGNGALAGNTTGDRNTAMGEGALLANTSGFQNIAIGVSTLRNNGTGHNNIAIGQDSCSQSSGGQFNTAVGSNTLEFNTADGNTAIGAFALVNNGAGASNTAIGAGALETNSAGIDNTADGLNALFSNTGNDNTALGFGAGAAATTGSNNVYIGSGMVGVAGESNACYIASIFGQTVDPTTNLAVFVDSHGKLGTTISSRRFKEDIKPMAEASEAVMALRPVTFHYKGDPKSPPQYGLIAEEVGEVNPNLVARDKNGEVMSVHYDQVWNMLLNEFLKEHKRVEEQLATIAALKSAVAQQRKDFEANAANQQEQIQALTTGLQKVSAEFAAANAVRGRVKASHSVKGRIERGGCATRVVLNAP